MRVQIDVTKRVSTNEGRTLSWLPDGTLSGEITLKIDHEKLARLLGPRALRSKAKRATLAFGAIVATASALDRRPA